MATDKPATTAAQPTGAIAALCDHAATMLAFFDRALRPPVECDRYDIFHAILPELRRYPGSGWGSNTAADWCGRSAVDAALRLGHETIPYAPIVDAARSKFRDLDAERKALLDAVSTLYPAAVREWLNRGMPDTAHRAVENLGDVLRGLRDVSEGDEWSDHRKVLSVAIEKARGLAAPLVEELKKPAAAPTPGDEKPAVHHSDDFTSVVWYGTAYYFKQGMQADSVKALWKQWEKSPGLGLHAGTILQTLDSSIERDRFRMPLVFRDHPAWGSMIVTAGKGIYRLAEPPQRPKQSRKRPSRKINGKSTQKRR
jgi:hypothetical protein